MKFYWSRGNLIIFGFVYRLFYRSLLLSFGVFVYFHSFISFSFLFWFRRIGNGLRLYFYFLISKKQTIQRLYYNLSKYLEIELNEISAAFLKFWRCDCLLLVAVITWESEVWFYMVYLFFLILNSHQIPSIFNQDSIFLCPNNS